MTAPASRSRAAMNASRGAIDSAERERAGARVHAVGGVNVVLDEHRNAVQRAANAPGFSLCIALLGDAHRVGIALDDRVDRGPGLVDRVDAREVQLGDRARGVAARLHAFLQRGDRRFLELERGLLETLAAVAG